MATVDIEIEEYLDEVRTVYLVRELLKRKDFQEVLNDERVKKNVKIDFRDITTPEFDDPSQLLMYIKKLLGLREWHSKDRILKEIESL